MKKYMIASIIGLFVAIAICFVDYFIHRTPGGEIFLAFLPVACVCGYEILRDWFSDLPELLGFPSVKKVASALPTTFEAVPHRPVTREYFDYELGHSVLVESFE